MNIIGYVFDLSKVESFNNIENWIQEIKQSGAEKVLPVLIGNKSDVSSNMINTSMIENLQSKYKFNYYQISTKTKEEVDNFFYELCSFAHDILYKSKKAR